MTRPLHTVLHEAVTGADLERFWRYVDRRGEDECWTWLGSPGTGPTYSHFWLSGLGCSVGAHRLSCAIATQAPVYVVRHACDNPRCVNPLHLTSGTYADNMADKVARGRGTHGERNPRAKLTEEDVQRMRVLRTEGWVLTRLAAEFDVSVSLAGQICQRLVWRHVV